MLETYELRSSLRGARKELAQSLYMHDAACRTIARLTQEKETAMKALEDVRSQFSEFQANPVPEGAAEGPAEGPPSKRVRPPFPKMVWCSEHAHARSRAATKSSAALVSLCSLQPFRTVA